MIEYDRSSTVSLAQVFDDERQESTIFRPTFKITYIYDNTYIGTTNYIPFQYNLYYVNPENSISSGLWKGFPQYYEFDFFRPDISDQHIPYKAKSAYTYNWTYYLSYAYRNNYDKKLFTVKLFGKFGPKFTFRSVNASDDNKNLALNINNWSYSIGDLELF